MTALEFWVCLGGLLVVCGSLAWPDIRQWLHGRGADPRPGYIYDQERER